MWRDRRCRRAPLAESAIDVAGGKAGVGYRERGDFALLAGTDWFTTGVLLPALKTWYSAVRLPASGPSARAAPRSACGVEEGNSWIDETLRVRAVLDMASPAVDRMARACFAAKPATRQSCSRRCAESTCPKRASPRWLVSGARHGGCFSVLEELPGPGPGPAVRPASGALALRPGQPADHEDRGDSGESTERNPVPSRTANRPRHLCGRPWSWRIEEGADDDSAGLPRAAGAIGSFGPCGCTRRTDQDVGACQMRCTVWSFVAYVPVPSRVEEPDRSDMVGPFPVLRLERKRRLPFVSFPR